MRDKILLVYDVDGWAWERRARDLIEFAPPTFEVKAVSQANFRRNGLHSDKTWNLMFFAWVECPTDIAARTTTLLANPCIQFDPWKTQEPDKQDWIRVGATRNRNRTNAKAKLKRFKRVICLTPELAGIAAGFGGNALCIPTGIHHTVFQPRQKLGNSPKLQVGWCGQVHDGKYNQKGYQWICEPLQELCKDFCEFQVNTRNYTTALLRSEMVNWYNATDVFLCTSIHEGTPTTAMEAMMCGRPAVTTSVGDMPNIIKDGENGYLTGSYCDRASADKIIQNTYDHLKTLHMDRNLLRQMGTTARQVMVDTRNWTNLASRWLEAIRDA